MAYIRVWIHLVWATKERQPFLNPSLRSSLFQHIRIHARDRGINLDVINGYVDHVHALVALRPDQTIANVVQILKGESSFWINHNSLTSAKFGWQDDYFAVSVGESMVDRVRDYIRDQEEHHRKKSFHQEYEEFMERYGFVALRG